ncbi:MAG: hypothetical protein M1834_006255 [Cirrosporium novae-zelandiae]|nr:MAG: hypothetical protein M1834_006255 [Cirrosporium novae-zelandiae]
MSSQSLDGQLSQAIIQSVQYGSFPDSDHVSAAELSSSALQHTLDGLDYAQNTVKEDIRTLSRDIAPDIDGWIIQARQLHTDIKKSQATARDIVSQHEVTQTLNERTLNSSNKLSLLQNELLFNNSLEQSLRIIKDLHDGIRRLEDSIFEDRIRDAIEKLLRLEDGLSALVGLEETRAAEILSKRISNLHGRVRKIISGYWDELVYFDPTTKTVTINKVLTESGSKTPSMKLSDVVTTLSELDFLDEKLDLFCKRLKDMVLWPRMVATSNGTLAGVQVERGFKITVSGLSDRQSLLELIKDLESIIELIGSNFPLTVIGPISERLMPAILEKLKDQWLLPTVPTKLFEILEFEKVLNAIKNFADYLNVSRWPGKMELVDWVEQLPRIWLTKRRENALDQVRGHLAAGLKDFKVVERTETQTVTSGGSDDWDAGWSDEGDNLERKSVPDNQSQPASAGDEDISGAWGFDADSEDADLHPGSDDKPGTDEDIEDAWGWGDETDVQDILETEISPKPEQTGKSNGAPEVQKHTEREVTLKETFSISSLPEEIFEVITQQIKDAEALAGPEYRVASASTGLIPLLPLILAMFKAVAPLFYETHESGNMYLYNDSLWLAEQLRTANQTPHPGRLKLDPDIETLESFGKLSYSREMETQRIILGDLLDGAQGFANCTESPFSDACDTAVSSVVDRIKQINAQWTPVLSRSALLQATGSLLSTIVSKILVDIESMDDISEPESQRLTAFCHQISFLNSLFLREKSDIDTSSEAVPLTAVYTPNWLKFEYLATILESSLVDIKGLWAEGYLKNEFTADELVDLIKALFAESEHRKKAIREIRGS